MLLEPWSRLADRLFPGLGEVEEDAQAEVLAEAQVHAGARGRLAVGMDGPLGHRRGAAADDALDAMFDHEVEPARAGADDGLPALHRAAQRAWDEGDLAELVAPIRDRRREDVVLAVVGEGLLVEGLHEDLDLLLEELPVGLRIQHGAAERLDLARVVAAAHAEDHTAAGEDIGGGEVLRQP